MSVERFYYGLLIESPSLTRDVVTDLVWQLARRGQVSLEDVLPATKSLRLFLRQWDRHLSFYFSLSFTLLTLLIVYAVPSGSSLVPVRWVIGFAFALLVPGYLAVEVLFPENRGLSGIERLALGVGLSLVIIVFTGLLLNYTPWGLRLNPLMMSLATLSIGLALLAFARRFGLSVAIFELQRLTAMAPKAGTMHPVRRVLIRWYRAAPCPSCGARRILPGMRYCDKCGSLIREQTETLQE